ncbi:MAG: sugar phosphate nucleotidyltransferase [Candidatus Omnitrophota bacterium]
MRRNKVTDIQTVILCGGKGARMGFQDIPKPMFGIGERPILWHIMNIYAHYGFNDFILSLGYKKEIIKEYFRDYHEWHICFADTGLDTNTGGRIKKVERFIKGDTFFVTYGDGLSNINLNALLDFHKRHKKIATLASVRPYSQFGVMSIDAHTGVVTNFQEKPVLDHWINGGFFVFNREVFRYLKVTDILESDTFSRLVKDKNLVAYKHAGFWECMDTYKDNLRLNQLWKAGNAPWAVWRKGKGR